jgi:hypothetical protein
LEQHFKIQRRLETHKRLFDSNSENGNGHEVEAVESMMTIMMTTNISKQATITSPHP